MEVWTGPKTTAPTPVSVLIHYRATCAYYWGKYTHNDCWWLKWMETLSQQCEVTLSQHYYCAIEMWRQPHAGRWQKVFLNGHQKCFCCLNPTTHGTLGRESQSLVAKTASAWLHKKRQPSRNSKKCQDKTAIARLSKHVVSKLTECLSFLLTDQLLYSLV